jgi:pSer/pThr/pTyr-binding forkhead associated (FHA) protein
MMQFALSGEASQVFCREFYGAVARGLPLDTALTETRKALFAARKTFEWAAPVLWSRSPDCKLFDLPLQTSQAAPGARRAYANLFVRQGEQTGRNFPLMAETYLIGRDERLSIPIEDIQVSRTHAQIIYNSLGFWIEDLNSRNGTFVNGMRITGKAPLRNGDTIRLGETTLVFDQETRPGTPMKLHPVLTEEESSGENEEVGEERKKIIALWAEIQIARQKKDWETAIARCEAILFLDPTHSKARSELTAIQKEQKIAQLSSEAQAAQEAKEWDTVIARLQTILNLEPGEILVRNELHEARQKRKAASLYIEAQKALAENNLPLATARLLAVLAIEPTHPQATADLVRLQRKNMQGNQEESSKA